MLKVGQVKSTYRNTLMDKSHLEDLIPGYCALNLCLTHVFLASSALRKQVGFSGAYRPCKTWPDIESFAIVYGSIEPSCINLNM